MPERIVQAWASIEIGDYLEGQGGVLWKVTRDATKADGRYLGLENGAGEKKILGPVENLPGAATRIVYGKVITMDEAEGHVATVLGGNVLAKRHEHIWVHPTLEHLESVPGLTAAHLVRFHGDFERRTDQPEDVVIRIHRETHAADGRCDHTHPEA